MLLNVVSITHTYDTNNFFSNFVKYEYILCSQRMNFYLSNKKLRNVIACDSNDNTRNMWHSNTITSTVELQM